MTSNILWQPGPERRERANLSRFLKLVRAEHDPDVHTYEDLATWAVQKPERFWLAVWDCCGIRASGDREPVRTRGDDGAMRWFADIRLNYAQNLLRHRDERCAMLVDGEEVSYATLHERVAVAASAWKARGLAAGDRVACTLPFGADYVVAFLAATGLGATWVEDAARATKVIEAALAGEREDALAWSSFPFAHPVVEHEGRAYGAGGLLIEQLKMLVLHVDLKREDHLLLARADRFVDRLYAIAALATGATLVFDARDPLDVVDAASVSVLWTDASTLARWSAVDAMPRDTHKLLALKTLLVSGDAPSPDLFAYAYRAVKERLMFSPMRDEGLTFVELGAPLLPVVEGAYATRGLALSDEDRGPNAPT